MLVPRAFCSVPDHIDETMVAKGREIKRNVLIYIRLSPMHTLSRRRNIK